MSFLWTKGGNLLLVPSGGLALVRAWTYRKQLSDCPPLPAWITIVGCNPPACIEYTNTNLSPTGRLYLRQVCDAWGGGSAAAYNYAWPADVPGCPYPSGVTITEEENCGQLVYLCVAVVVTEGSFYDMTGCPFYGEGCYPAYSIGNMGRGPWSIGCSYWGGKWEYISIDCFGNVAFYSGYHYAGYYGTGTPITLNAEDLPIGSSVIPVYYEGSDVYDYFGTLTITVSKC